jgi:hypothetical protein
MKFREKKSTEEALTELQEMTGITNRSELVERSILMAVILGKLDEENFKKNLLYSSLYRNNTLVEVLTSIGIYPTKDYTKYSSTKYSSKKHEEFSVIPNKTEESYQQITLSDKVKTAMPFGEQFAEAWLGWRRHVKHRTRTHLTPDQELAQFKRITDNCKTEEEAVNIINTSIAQNYAGLIIPTRQANHSGKGKGFTGIDPEDFRAEAERLRNDLKQRRSS